MRDSCNESSCSYLYDVDNIGVDQSDRLVCSENRSSGVTQQSNKNRIYHCVRRLADAKILNVIRTEFGTTFIAVLNAT